MTKEESTRIVDRIKVYRQNFTITDLVYREWFKVLNAYDYAEVDEKLDKYFKDLDNEGKIPNPHYLVKYLRTQNEKQNIGSFKVECPNCGLYVDLEDLDGKHYDRCLSTRYIVAMRKKYFNKETDIEELNYLSDKIFWDKYYDFISILSKMEVQEKDKLIRILEDKDSNKRIEQITLRM